MMLNLNSWASPLFKDSTFFEIDPLVQKLWLFDVTGLLYLLKIFKKITPISQKSIIRSMKNLRFEVWGQNQHVCQISLISERVGFSPLRDLNVE